MTPRLINPYDQQSASPTGRLIVTITLEYVLSQDLGNPSPNNTCVGTPEGHNSIKPDEADGTQSRSLDAVARALSVHPRTLLRLTSELPNPYWARGFNPEVDINLIAARVGNTPASIDVLIAGDDFALDVNEASKMLKIKPMAFYSRKVPPDWKVGRVKRYSLHRIGSMARGR